MRLRCCIAATFFFALRVRAKVVLVTAASTIYESMALTVIVIEIPAFPEFIARADLERKTADVCFCKTIKTNKKKDNKKDKSCTSHRL